MERKIKMLTVTTTKGTKLTHKKTVTLDEVSEKGFLISNDEGNEYITLDLIKELFLGKEIKFTIEEISREIVEV